MSRSNFESLKNTAEACNSDSNYGGIFPEVIPSNNNTLVVLQRDYCLLNYLLANDLLRINIENINPKGIDTVDLDCDTIIQHDRQNEIKIRGKDLMKTISSQSFSNCVLDEYRNHNIYEANASIKIIDQLDPLDSKLNAERKRIVDSLNEFSQNLVSCSSTWSQTMEGKKFQSNLM